ncbi:MAG: SHOCT-like domain-containing protein [Candidatus Hydrothermia bacterium]
MREEILIILRMVEQGKLSAEEAERLLSLLETHHFANKAGVGISFGRRVRAEYVERELLGREDLMLAISASRAELRLWQEDKIKVEAWLEDLGSVEETARGLEINMARARIHLPSTTRLTLELSASKAEGEVPPVTNLTCSAGKAELRGMREGVISCSAGKTEITLTPEPGPLELEVNAGKLELLVPCERKMRVIREEVNAGGVFVDRGLEDPSAPQATIRCCAGKVSIRKK